MGKQSIYEGTDILGCLCSMFRQHKIHKYMVVGGSVAGSERMRELWSEIGIPYVFFRDFTPNPTYDSVVKGVELFRREQCEALVAVGGGSAIDVAKCIKAFSGMTAEEDYLEQKLAGNRVVFAAVPTTAGTGSESTSFAVIYKDGEKQSVTHDSLLPQSVILDGRFLEGLPDVQKKSTLLDALCQAIESKWSVHATKQSQELADEAISTILSWREEYLAGSQESNDRMMHAANLAGQAINLTQTTAAHAMSYKITSLFGIPHGYAVALCLPHVWRYMIGNVSLCSDVRGPEHLQDVLEELAALFGVSAPGAAVGKFQEMVSRIGIDHMERVSPEQLEELAASVNPGRLKNNPVPLSQQVLLDMYSEIFSIAT